MKSLLALVLVLVSSSAFAAAANEVRTPISAIHSVSFDGKMLVVGYMMFGGCAAHRGEVDLAFDITKGTITAKVVDIADQVETCHQILNLEARVDVRAEIDRQMKKHGPIGGAKLVLPEVVFDTM